MSGAITAFAAVGFLTNLLGSPLNQRAILVPATDSSGNPVTNADGQQITTAVDGYVAIEEVHRNSLTVTDHPVEQGSVISDHAYENPAELRMRLGWSPAMSGDGGVTVLGVALPTLSGLFGDGGAEGNAFLKSVYQQMLAVMANRELLTILTGKLPYSNMLLVGMSERTSEETENALILDLEFRQIIIVSTSTINVPPGMSSNQQNLADPQAATPTQNQGTKSLMPGSSYNSPAAAPFIGDGTV